MPKTVEYFYALQSPFTYLGSRKFEEILSKHDARVECRPCNLLEVFKVTGGTPVSERPPARQNYRLVELDRWARERGTPINLQPAYFPVPDEAAARLAIAAHRAGEDMLTLSHAILRAVWAEDRDIEDRDTLKHIANDCGMDGAALLEASRSEACRNQYRANTEEAMERGIFGAPWYVYEGEPFWGQDRLELLDKALSD